MTTDQEMKISSMVLTEIINLCELHKIDYTKLDKDHRELLISVFQLGVGFIKRAIDNSTI